MKATRKVHFQHLGMIPYLDGFEYQREVFWGTVDRKMANRKLPGEEQLQTKNHLIFCQHPHVYTLGNSGDPANLLIDEQGLQERDAVFVRTNRGGDITYHGPGQIVGYPIFDLDHFFTDIEKYLRSLEEAIIRTLAVYGIQGMRVPGLTGVWIDGERKIAAMGVRSSRWVTMHGFSLNVNTDLSYFGHIVPCGIRDKEVTSLQQEVGNKIEEREVEEMLKKHLAAIFEFELIE